MGAKGLAVTAGPFRLPDSRLSSASRGRAAVIRRARWRGPLGYPNSMARPPAGFRERLDRSTWRALLLGSGVLIVTVLVEAIRAG